MSKVDLHLHTYHSKRSSEWLLRRLDVPSSMSKPHDLYKKLRHAGMDFVTFTDYDSIEGCLEIAHLEGVFLSEQVTAIFPEDGCRVSLLLWGITEEQHRAVQQSKENIYELQSYLAKEEIAHGVAAPLTGFIDQLQPLHLMKLALLFRHIEGVNGRRPSFLNEVTRFFFSLNPEDIERFSDKTGVGPTHEEPWRKLFFGGSDDHGGTMMGRAYTEVHGVKNAVEFLDKLRKGHGVAHGPSGSPLSLALDTYQVAFSFAKERWSGKKDNLGLKLLEKAFGRFMEGRNPTIFSASEKWSFLIQGIASGKIFEMVRSGNHSLWKELSHSLADSSMKADLARQIDGVKDPSRRAFGIANLLASRLAYRFIIQFISQLKSGKLLESIQMVSPVVPLVAVLSPYFYAFRRPPLKRLRQAALAMFGQVPDLLSNRRRAWFTDTLDDVNGVSITIQKMTAATVEQGHDLTVMVSRMEVKDLEIPFKNFEPIGEFELPEYELQKLSFPPLLPIIDYLEKEKFSEIIISTPGPVGLGALCAAKVLGLPTVGIYHTDFPQYVRILTEDGLMETLTWNYMHWFYSQMDMIYVNSEHYRRCWVDRGFPKEKIHIFPRGLDTVFFHPQKRCSTFWTQRGLEPAFKVAEADEGQGTSERRVRNVYGIPEDSSTGVTKPFAASVDCEDRLLKSGEVGALYVGRISREKNLDLLAAAFRRLLAQGVKVRTLFVGNGPYLSTMKELLPEGLFVGSLHGEELAAAYASADFFVFPSTTDTFGNVVIEAQASGLPVIVSDVGGPKDLVGHEKDGLITKALDLDALTEAMRYLIKEEKLRKAWGIAARERVSERDWLMAAQIFWEGSQE
ncbi:MAG TPA: glycosyltransferase [Chthoniobacterales bacterium]|nr:glycosyltransferase [Chthoniobacterales bacterium]